MNISLPIEIWILVNMTFLITGIFIGYGIRSYDDKHKLIPQRGRR